MNKSHAKLVARLQPKSLNTLPVNSQPQPQPKQPKPSLKRKRDEPPPPRAVRPKLESSNNRPGDDLQVRIQLKKGPMHSSQQLPRKENVIKPMNKSQSLSKSAHARGDSVLSAIQKSLQKFGGKAPRTATVDKQKTSTGPSISEQRAQAKAILKAKFDELMKSVQEFGQKRGLFGNLKDLTNQMENDCNPAYEVSSEKIKQVEQEFEDRKNKQSLELENLRARIVTFKETQHALALSLSEKRQMNQKIEKQEEELKNKVRSYDEFIKKNRELLSQLLNRKEELGAFELKVEEAIRNTKEKVRMRYDDISVEEKKLLILEELLHSKKQSVRTFLLLRGEKSSLASSDSETLYRIHTHENSRKIKLEINKSLADHNPRFFEFDSIYQINNYHKREERIFSVQDIKLYTNILSTIFGTEQMKGYVFFMLSYDKSIALLVKQILGIIVQTQIDKDWEQEPLVTQAEFDTQGKITHESLYPLTSLGMTCDGKENYLLTFQAKLRNFANLKQFTFVVVSGFEKDLLDTFKKSVTITKSKKANVMMIGDNSFNNQSVPSYLQDMASGSAVYAMLSLDNEQKRAHTDEISSQNSLDYLTLLNTLNRLKC